jgi:uncharacterized membrane protein YbhN (UPF0104 family)
MQIGLTTRHLVLCALSLGLLTVAATSPQLLRDQLSEGAAGLADASPGWLWFAAACFVASLALSGAAWRAGLRSCGGELGMSDAAATYGVGSLVNSLAPAKLGTALRVVLYTRSLHGEGRVWTAGGICSAIGAAQTFWLAVLVGVAASAGVVPLWPLALLAGVLVAAVAAAVIAQRIRPRRRVTHVLDAFRALGRSPRSTAALLGWTGVATVARVGASAALLASFGLPRPLVLAVLLLPAIELAATLPLTPGNIGVGGAAVAFALHTQGVATDTALAAGIALNAVETLSSMAFGVGSVLHLAGGTTVVRRRLVAATGVTACTVVAGAFSWTVLVPPLS